MKSEKGLLILVEKIGGKLNIIKEDFNINAKTLMRDYFDTKLEKNQGIALIGGENREKFMFRGIKIPSTIKTAIPM